MKMQVKNTKQNKTYLAAGIGILCLLLFAIFLGCSGASEAAQKKFTYEYGVFLNAEPKDIPRMKDYRIIVLDAQYYSKKNITKLKKAGHTVLSYINLGSIEEFRPYYKDYEDLTLSVYENWEDERWVDVTKKRWQNFVGKTLANRLLKKGVDGFFVDNTDVYYHYKTKAVFKGVTNILKKLKKKGYVLINGGDTYVKAYGKKYKTLKPILSGVNQETIFSAVDWENGRELIANDDENRRYFKSYVKFVKSFKKDVYLLEYTKDKSLIKKIKSYCRKNKFKYYITDTLDLTVP